MNGYDELVSGSWETDRDEDDVWLLESLARDEAESPGSISHSPGYAEVIARHPEMWEMLLEQARGEQSRREEQHAQAEAIYAEVAPRISEEINAPTLEQVRAMRQRLGRKFEKDDLTVGLKQFARDWIADLGTAQAQISFSPNVAAFLLSVKTSFERRGSLSDGQAKGVLNIATAEVPEWVKEKQEREAKPKPEVPEVTEGMYTHDGKIYKVVKAVHGSGRLYAKELTEGGFEYAAGIVYKLSAEEKMTLEQAAEYGRLYGVCCVCGTTLTDEDSIAAGIGPICASKGWW